MQRIYAAGVLNYSTVNTFTLTSFEQKLYHILLLLHVSYLLVENAGNSLDGSFLQPKGHDIFDFQKTLQMRICQTKGQCPTLCQSIYD